MIQKTFPIIQPKKWHDTRYTLASYAQVLGKIRRALTPEQKHWWHISLQVAVSGLTTTPISADHQTFALLLDLLRHRTLVTTSSGASRSVPVHGQSIRRYKDEILSALAELGIEVKIDEEPFSDDSPREYDPEQASLYWQALTQVDITLKEFQHSLRRETSPVQLWPHHFDIAFNWFSGRLIPDQDPSDADYSAEQMNFGFSPGDEGIPEPYFYATAYPTPEGLTDGSLPSAAKWQTEGWTGAILLYANVAEAADGRQLLSDFLRSSHAAGAKLMDAEAAQLAPEPNASIKAASSQ